MKLLKFFEGETIENKQPKGYLELTRSAITSKLKQICKNSDTTEEIKEAIIKQLLYPKDPTVNPTVDGNKARIILEIPNEKVLIEEFKTKKNLLEKEALAA